MNDIKKDFDNGKLVSLSAYTNKDKYSGLLIKKTKKGITYYMKYRDATNKVIKKAISGIENITHDKAFKEFSRIKLEVEDIKKGITPAQKKAKNKLSTLNEMADYYFLTHKFRSSGQEQSRYDYYFRNKEFSSKLFILVTVEEILDFRKELENRIPNNILKTQKIGKKSNYPNKRLSPKTINNAMILARTIVTYAIDNKKYLGENIFRSIKNLKVNNVTLKQMSEFEIENYLKTVKEVDIERDNYKISYLFALLALTTGARVQTILDIEISNIDLKKRTINIYNLKTETAYICHIVSDHIADIIQEVIYSNGIPNRKYLFCLLGSESRYKNYPNPVRRILDSVINDTRDDKNKLTVRDFRNVFATRLINKGMNLSHIQNLLNHKTPAMTMRYARMLDTTGGDELKEMFVGVKL